MKVSIPLAPTPKERPRFGRRAYTPRKTQDAEAVIGWYWRMKGGKPLKGPVSIKLWFYMANRRRTDWDNLAKLVCDALNGLAYEDDSQIMEAHVFKTFPRENVKPHIVVEVDEC